MKSLYLIFLLIFPFSLSASTWHPVHSQVEKKSQPTFESGTLQKGKLQFNLQGFSISEVQTPDGIRQIISSPGAIPMQEKGKPDLPQFAASLIIPDQGTVSFSIVKSEFTDYPGIDLAPSKGNLYRNINPADIPFFKDNIFQQDMFWPSALTAERAPYILRDFRGQTLLIRPFTWNPITKVLRVYTYLEVEYSNDATLAGQNEIARAAMPVQVDKDFYYMYRNQFVNSGAVQYVPLSEEGKMLIICEQAWMSEMDRFVNWKKKRGLPVEMVSVQSVGNTVGGITAYIANYYQTNGLTFVLLVGDAGQIVTPTLSGGASDPSYGYLSGNDSYPEVIIGRFSAESQADVTTHIDRILHYEQNIDLTDNWMTRGVVVASDQGPGDDNEMDWEHAVNMRTDLLAFTYTQIDELYDGTHTSTSDAAGDPLPVDLFTLFQDGISIMTYTGHGSSNACSTTGMSSSDVENMTNVNRLPFIWSVACVNGEFTNSTPCIAETFMRTQYNDQPVGAISTLMSSINQSWNPPMDAQDEMVDLLSNVYPGMNRRTFGGLSVNGCMHMNDNYGASGDEMTDTWHCFGDPSLLVRTAPAMPQGISTPAVAMLGWNSISVMGTSDSSLVCLTINGEILATGIILNGVCQLNFPALNGLDTIHITVTGFNLQTYQSVIPVIPASGPYVISQGGVIDDATGNNNLVAEYAETVSQEIILNNLGSADASTLQVVVSTTDAYITMNTSTFNYPLITSSSIANIPAAINYTIANNVPDQHVVHFTVTITDNNSNTWTSGFTQVMNAPLLDIDFLAIDDAIGGNNNQQLEAGESAVVTVKCKNNGHSDALSTTGLLTSLSPYISITNPLTNPVAINAGADAIFTYNVSLAPNVSIGTYFDLTVHAANGAYTDDHTFGLQAGIILETFESNNFNTFSWTMQGQAPWLTTTNQPFEGNYCSVSGAIGHNETSDLLLSVNVINDDSVSFWYKVSSEQNYDFLFFYVDGTFMNGWSGSVPWSYRGYALTAGQHTLRWSYEKDVMVAAGDDCSWLDNIRLPIGTTITGISQVNRNNDELSVFPNPASDNVNLLLGSTTAEMQLTITDPSGRTMRSMDAVEFLNGAAAINVSVLSNGIYFIRITDKERTWSVPVLVNH